MPRRPLPVAGAARARGARGLHGAQLPLDRLGGVPRGRRWKAPTARCSTCWCSPCSPAGRQRGRDRRRAAARRGRCRWPAWRVYVLLHLDGASQSGLAALIPGGRLDFPTGYPNANAAAVADGLLAGAAAGARARACRGRCAACSRRAPCCSPRSRCSARAAARCTRRRSRPCSCSRCCPPRTRTFALLVPVAAGVAAAAPAVLRVGDHLHRGEPSPRNVHSAIAATLLAAVARRPGRGGRGGFAEVRAGRSLRGPCRTRRIA